MYFAGDLEMVPRGQVVLGTEGYIWGGFLADEQVDSMRSQETIREVIVDGPLFRMERSGSEIPDAQWAPEDRGWNSTAGRGSCRALHQFQRLPRAVLINSHHGDLTHQHSAVDLKPLNVIVIVETVDCGLSLLYLIVRCLCPSRRKIRDVPNVPIPLEL